MKLCQPCAPRRTPLLPWLAGLLMAVPWCARAEDRAAADERARADANAEILSAEVALQAGECAAATREYDAAIQRVEDAALAGRATGVALEKPSGPDTRSSRTFEYKQSTSKQLPSPGSK